MIAVPKAPAARRRSLVSRLTLALRRHWLLFQIDSARIHIKLMQNLIDNDVAVMRTYPEFTDKVRPQIDAYFHQQEVEAKRLTNLQLKLLKLDFNL